MKVTYGELLNWIQLHPVLLDKEIMIKDSNSIDFFTVDEISTEDETATLEEGHHFLTINKEESEKTEGKRTEGECLFCGTPYIEWEISNGAYECPMCGNTDQSNIN